MPKVDITKAKTRTTSIYPPEFEGVVRGREKTALGSVVGLTQFGVNLTRLKPGAASGLRHWHEAEDEFVYVLEGEITLIEDDGETVLKPGDAVGYKAGVANAHHLVNKSARDALYLEIGTRAVKERVHYADADLLYEKDEKSFRFTHKNGEPYA
jgi:uncharacterized cupin superfamily protein